LDDVGVEAAAQATVRRHHHQEMALLAARSTEQLWRTAVVPHAGRDVCKNGLHLLGIRPRGFGGFLRALQLGGRDELHRARDLARRFDGRDAVTKVLEAGHLAYAKLFEKLSSTDFSFASSSGVNAFCVRMPSSRSLAFARMCAISPFSNRPIALTASLSRYPR